MLGRLQKMTAQLTEPVSYQLVLSESLIALNPLIGKAIKLIYTGQIFCLHCQTKTKKSFNQTRYRQEEFLE